MFMFNKSGEVLGTGGISFRFTYGKRIYAFQNGAPNLMDISPLVTSLSMVTFRGPSLKRGEQKRNEGHILIISESIS